MKEKDEPVIIENVIDLREKGNDCFKNKKYEEAILHYTEAIKLDVTNYRLYSNRSSAFLHLQQYYLALEDARETIKLQPQWAKGYFRKGEVEYHTFNFLDALVSYQAALLLQPGDATVESAVERTRQKMRADRKADDQIPWLGAAIGIIIGVSIVIADHVFTHKPSLTHPITMVIVTIVVALFGYGGCRAFRQYIKNQRSGMLEPPIDLLQGQQTVEENIDDDIEKTRPRFTKAQARQRFKKGKL